MSIRKILVIICKHTFVKKIRIGIITHKKKGRNQSYPSKRGKNQKVLSDQGKFASIVSFFSIAAAMDASKHQRRKKTSEMYKGRQKE